MRQLSFASASTPPASQPLSKKASSETVDKPELSQSEQDLFASASLAEDAEQIVPASPQQEEEASPQQKEEASPQQEAASSSQPTAPAAKSDLPQPGSTTLIGISGEDRYNITYEARQLLYSVYADEDQERAKAS